MPFPREKRAFLVAHMGEEKVKEIEERLGSLSKQLMAEGVEFKELDDCLDGLCSGDKGHYGEKQDMSIPRPAGGATSWQELRANEVLAGVETDIADLWNQFESVASNIRMADRPSAEKATLLKSAVADFLKAVGQVKPGQPAGSKAKGKLDPIIEDLRSLGPRPLTTATKAAVKELGKLRDRHVAPYLQDLAQGKVVRGD